MRVLFSVLWVISAVAGYASPKSAWPLPKRKFLLVPGVYYYRATSYWSPDRSVQAFGNDGRFTSVNIRLYGEYGLSDRLTLVGTLPFVANTYQSRPLSTANQGLTDAELGLRYNLLNVQNRRYLSMQAAGILPLYRNSGQTPFLGFASAGLEARLLYAGNLRIGSRNAYFNTEVGYRHYVSVGSYPVRQVPLLATLGWYVSDKDVLTGELSGLIASSNRFRELNPVNPTVNTDFRFVKANLSYGRRVSERTWLYAGVYHDLYGKNVGIGRGFSVTSIIRF